MLLIKITSSREISTGFKKTTRNPDFADLALANCMEKKPQHQAHGAT